ncbi:glycosyltransferase family 2 protein [Pleomorphomonas sp. JP5]|uniref:glycosyltransferase family 2 protein n=1 Tax=Pleomorphomonas sp. JP5 TaxID=2942998 RepID=UPI0020432702|nr:glycosyltransferase family 2 protein [Pleomorphomonas sp. JP5]MCM5557661.1 glycosyltransferase [Pleomorphomonas sp. JP5]
MSAPLLSFISAVYNKADVVLETLALLQRQRGIPEDAVEFVFADDASTDGSLQALRQAAETDPRIKVIANEENRGPAIRFNQAAAAATGKYLLALDADDMVPANAPRFLIDTAKKTASPVVFGQSRRSDACPDIPQDAAVTVSDSPLAFCASRKIVRMGFLCERQLWAAAGGADEQVFIQDQSLPLRLSAAAERLAYVESHIYFLRPTGESNLSRNHMQQHHDRFFALLPFLERPGLTPGARRALVSQLVSAAWKARRDSGERLPALSQAALAYALNRLTGFEPSPRYLAARAAELRSLHGIRRPGAAP